VSAEERSGGAGWFDVEPFRAAGHRVVVVRRVTSPAIVLGSTQDERVVDRQRASQAGFAVVRRRSGGGAVLVGPGDPWWFDLWIPRGDPLFDDDVGRAPAWVGECWVTTLGALGLGDPGGLQVHRGPPVRAPWSDLVCFAGIGPGEVVATFRGSAQPPRKVVGIAQWRGREGVLFHCAAYRRWDPRALSDLLVVPGPQRRELGPALAASAAGLEQLGGAVPGPGQVIEAFLGSLPGDGPWEARSGV